MFSPADVSTNLLATSVASIEESLDSSLLALHAMLKFVTHLHQEGLSLAEGEDSEGGEGREGSVSCGSSNASILRTSNLYCSLSSIAREFSGIKRVIHVRLVFRQALPTGNKVRVLVKARELEM